MYTLHVVDMLLTEAVKYDDGDDSVEIQTDSQLVSAAIESQSIFDEFFFK